MNQSKLARNLIRIFEEPKVLMARLKGLQSDHAICCLTARKLTNKPFQTIIDIGANKGIFIDVCKWLFPNAKIYAFEPLPEFYNKIKKVDNVVAFNYGLWDKEGKDTIYYNKVNPGASSFLKPTKEYDKYIEGKGNIAKRG